MIERGDRIAQPERAILGRTEFKLESGQIHGGGRDMQPRHRGRHHGIAQRRFADQHVVGRDVAAAAVDAEAGGGVALRIEVDDQHPLADRGQRGAEIDRRGGLADAALLVGERNDARVTGRGVAPYPLDIFDQLRSCAATLVGRRTGSPLDAVEFDDPALSGQAGVETRR